MYYNISICIGIIVFNLMFHTHIYTSLYKKSGTLRSSASRRRLPSRKDSVGPVIKHRENREKQL